MALLRWFAGWGLVGGVLIAGGLGGCAAKVVNATQVYKPLGGTLELAVTVPSNEAFTRVQFQINDQLVSEDTDPADGYKAELDTSGLEPEVLAKVAAVGVRADGTTRVLREHLILVAATGASAPLTP